MRSLGKVLVEYVRVIAALDTGEMDELFSNSTYHTTSPDSVGIHHYPATLINS
jgi:hypothetical protein